MQMLAGGCRGEWRAGRDVLLAMRAPADIRAIMM
jgi:hypothetical protein